MLDLLLSLLPSSFLRLQLLLPRVKILVKRTRKKSAFKAIVDSTVKLALISDIEGAQQETGGAGAAR